MSRISDQQSSAPERPRFLSEADCREIVKRLERFSIGGGYTSIKIATAWTGSVRWARSQVNTSQEMTDNRIFVQRDINGASATVTINDTTDAALVAAVRRAERLIIQDTEKPNTALMGRLPQEPSLAPHLFSDATYQLGTEKRAAAAIALTKQARDAGMLAAGYIEVAAMGLGVFDTLDRVRYFAYTQARYSVTVRNPKGTGSGWAGVDWYDWNKIDAGAITALALEKCLKSQHPVAIEPGRYTTILEPQAVSDFIGEFVRGHALNGSANEGGAYPPGPFLKSEPVRERHIPGYARLGEQVIDKRITISSDPTSADMGFPPFYVMDYLSMDPFVNVVYHPVTWIENGVLTTLSYDRFQDYGGYKGRNENLGMPNSHAFRMSGGDTSMDEMIATTKRGLLVTRFDQVVVLDFTSQLYRGLTRDGLWLIENGKISKAVKNMVFTESVLFALNNVEQLGAPQRAFHPNLRWEFGQLPQPAVVPPLKVNDFSFTALCDAI